MRHVALALALSSAAALAEEPKVPGDVICADDKAICREDCTLEYGTSNDTKDKIAKCFNRCEQAHTVCLQGYLAKRSAAPHAGTPGVPQHRPDEAPSAPLPDPKAPTRFSAEQPPAPPPAEPADEAAPVRRTATRANELEPAPDMTPLKYPDRAAPPGPAPDVRSGRGSASELDPPPPPPEKGKKKK